MIDLEFLSSFAPAIFSGITVTIGVYLKFIHQSDRINRLEVENERMKYSRLDRYDPPGNPDYLKQVFDDPDLYELMKDARELEHGIRALSIPEKPETPPNVEIYG